ncbi:MAG: hypothetical protein PHQ10_03015 [Dehalococcoidales bacterium]|jgi:hypothetical protein|nr:hypothetical protein [Dehalococcoidales bacterium]MDD3265404.1 hypothetical protein [Dehalococcoidales bacterium]MDX9802547.1 hypothetical protein [Dehalococcoidales bacterium]
MKIYFNQEYLDIKLNPLEKYISFHGSLSIPLINITGAIAEKPDWNMLAVRSPGTNIPFILKAGTYHAAMGAEFWCATIRKKHLVIFLNGWNYQRMVLSPGNPDELAEKINQAR